MATATEREGDVLENLFRQSYPAAQLKRSCCAEKFSGNEARAIVRAVAWAPVMRKLCESVDKSHPVRDRFPQKIHESTCALVRRLLNLSAAQLSENH